MNDRPTDADHQGVRPGVTVDSIIIRLVVRPTAVTDGQPATVAVDQVIVSYVVGTGSNNDGIHTERGIAGVAVDPIITHHIIIRETTAPVTVLMDPIAAIIVDVIVINEHITAVDIEAVVVKPGAIHLTIDKLYMSVVWVIITA